MRKEVLFMGLGPCVLRMGEEQKDGGGGDALLLTERPIFFR